MIARAVLRVPSGQQGGRVVLVCLVAAAAALTPAVLGQIRMHGSATTRAAFDLAPGSEPAGATLVGATKRNLYGYYLRPETSGAVWLTFAASVKRGEQAVLRLYAYGGRTLRTKVAVAGGDGKERELGHPGRWFGRGFDVTREARTGELSLLTSSRNTGSSDSLFLDRVELAVSPTQLGTGVSPLLMATWVALIVAVLLQGARRLKRHWLLPIIVWVGIDICWRDVRNLAPTALSPTASDTWLAATQADWFGLHHGLLTGAFGPLSPLCVQLFHALTPLVGRGDAAARAASTLIGAAALAAFYALGHRAAGRIGAAAGAMLVLVSDPFRDAAVSGTDTTARILVTALFLFAVHAALAEVSTLVVVLLAVTGALVVLADPLWLAGVALTLAVLTLTYARLPARQRLRLTATALVLLALLIVPNRLSVGDQYRGNVFGDLTERATLAASTSNGRVHTKRIGMGAYLFDRSPTAFAGGALRGLDRSLKKSATPEDSGIAGFVAFAITVLGTLMLLIVPRLRLLVLLAALIAIPGFFLTSRNAEDGFDAVVPLWSAMVVGGAVLLYVLLRKRFLWQRVPLAREASEEMAPPVVGMRAPTAGLGLRRNGG